MLSWTKTVTNKYRSKEKQAWEFKKKKKKSKLNFFFKNQDRKIKIKRRTKANVEGWRQVGIIELTHTNTYSYKTDKWVRFRIFNVSSKIWRKRKLRDKKREKKSQRKKRVRWKEKQNHALTNKTKPGVLTKQNQMQTVLIKLKGPSACLKTTLHSQTHHHTTAKTRSYAPSGSEVLSFFSGISRSLPWI